MQFVMCWSIRCYFLCALCETHFRGFANIYHDIVLSGIIMRFDRIILNNVLAMKTADYDGI